MYFEAVFTGQHLNRELTAPLEAKPWLRHVDPDYRRAQEMIPALRTFVPYLYPIWKQLL